MRRGARISATRGKIDLACLALYWAVPAGAGLTLLAPSALGQTYDPDASDIQITHTAGIGAIASTANAPFTVVDVPGTTSPSSPLPKYKTPTGETTASHAIYVGAPPTNVYQISQTTTSNSSTTGPQSSSGYGAVGETGGTGNTSIVLGAGSGITQVNPSGAYPYASELYVDVASLTYRCPTGFTGLGGFPAISYAFPVGGTLPVGGSVNFGVSLTYYYYNTSASTTSFQVSNTTLTPVNVGSVNINETFTNNTNTSLAFTNTNPGSLLFNNGVGITTPGYIVIEGDITFEAIVDSPAGPTPDGLVATPTGGSTWQAPPSPTSFELYLPQTGSSNVGAGPGNTFEANGSGNDLTQTAAWTDVTGLPLGPPGAKDIALFAGDFTTLAAPATYTVGPATAWNGISMINPGAAITISPSSGGGDLTLGQYGITYGVDAQNKSQNLTLALPVSLSAPQSWNVGGGQTVDLNTGSLNLGSNTLTINGGGNVNISTSVSGSGGVVMNGGGLLTLSGANNFTGGATLNNGETSVSSDANLGGAGTAVTFNGGILQVTGTTLNNLNSHVVNWPSFAGGFDIVDPNNTFTVSQNIGNAALDSGSVTKLGLGTLVLSGVNTYVGPTNIDGGALRIANTTAINPASPINVNSTAGLILSNNVQLNNAVTLNNLSGEFLNLPDANEFAILAGPVTASGLYELGFNNTTANLDVTGPNVGSNSNLTVVSEGYISFVGTGSLSGALDAPVMLATTSNSLTLNMDNDSSLSNKGFGGIQVGGGGNPAFVQINVNDQASINAGNGGDFNLDFTSATASTVVSLNLSGGNVSVQDFSASPLNENPSVVLMNFNGGVVTALADNPDFFPDGAGGAEVNLNVSSRGAIINSNGYNITIDTPSGFNQVSTSPGGGVAKNGAGELTLGQDFASQISSPFTGPTIVNGGLLEYNNSDQFGATAFIRVNAGGAVGLDTGSTDAGLMSELAASGVQPAGALAITANDASTTFNYTAAAGGFRMASPLAGSTLNLTNMSIGAVSDGVTYTGTIEPGIPAGFTAQTYLLGGGDVLTLPDNVGETSLVDYHGVKTNVLIENGGAVALPNTETYTGSTTIEGIEVLTIPAADSPTGANQFQLEATTLQVASLDDNASSLGNSSPSNAANLVINGGILQYVGGGDTSNRVFTIGQLGATIDSSGAGSLDLSPTAAEQFSTGVSGAVVLTLTGQFGAIGSETSTANVLASNLVDPAGGSLGLIKDGPGAWTLTGSNAYSGPTTIQNGILALGSAGALGKTSGVTVASAGALDLEGHSVSILSLSGGGTIDNILSPLSVTLTVNDSANTTFSGTIQNTGGPIGLTKSGAGVLTLSGNNTYSGPTTLSAGELSISDPSNIGPSLNFSGGALQVTGTTMNDLNSVNVNGSGASASATWSSFPLSLDISDPQNVFTVSQNLTGALSLTKLGAGTLILSGNNSYSGGTDIEAGTLEVPSLSTLGNGPLVDNAQLLFTTTAAATLTSSTSGVGGLTIGGTVALAGSNTYSGPTVINYNGALTINGNASLPSNSDVVNNGLLTLNAAVSAGTISGGGTTAVGPGVTFYTSGFIQGNLINNGNTTIGCGGTVGAITGTGSLQIGISTMVGNLQISPGSGPSTQGAVSVFSGSTLDITNNKLVINYLTPAADPISSIAAALASGYNGGTWTGTGIISSTAAAGSNKFTIGYLDGNNAADAAKGTVAPNQLIVQYTLVGDAFLEGSVGFDDLLAVAQHYGETGWGWSGGDFDYDPAGSVGFGDLLSVAQNYGSVLSISGDGGSSAVTVPEPTSCLLVAAGVGILAPRRRRVRPARQEA